MDWFKKHADTIAILGTFAICFWTLNEKMETRFNEVDRRFTGIERDMATIKTVLILKNIMPSDMACDKGD